MLLLLASNALYSFYYVLMSVCVTSPLDTHERLTEMQFVCVSNLAAVVTLAILFLTVPCLGAHARALERVSSTPKVVSMLAELANYASMCFLSVALARHYNVGLITAARAGVNQFTNVLLAVPAYRWLRIGRPTEELGRKLLAAGIVSFGLWLSTWDEETPAASARPARPNIGMGLDPT
jgi:hypothetical protein